MRKVVELEYHPGSLAPSHYNFIRLCFEVTSPPRGENKIKPFWIEGLSVLLLKRGGPLVGMVEGILGITRSNDICKFWSNWLKVASGWRRRAQFLSWLLLELVEEKRMEAGKGWCRRQGYTGLGRMDEICLFMACGITGGILPSSSTGLIVCEKSTSQSRCGACNHGALPMLLSFMPHLICHQVWPNML